MVSGEQYRTETDMSYLSPLTTGAVHSAFISSYLDALSLVERLHRLLLDVIKDEFERVGVLEINAVQALLLFNIGDHEVTAGELKTRGYYQGSNVSYNLKKLVDMGYMHHQRCEVVPRGWRGAACSALTGSTRSPRRCAGSSGIGPIRSAISIDAACAAGAAPPA